MAAPVIQNERSIRFQCPGAAEFTETAKSRITELNRGCHRGNAREVLRGSRLQAVYKSRKPLEQWASGYGKRKSEKGQWEKRHGQKDKIRYAEIILEPRRKSVFQKSFCTDQYSCKSYKNKIADQKATTKILQINFPLPENDRSKADEEIPVLPRKLVPCPEKRRTWQKAFHYNTDRENWNFLAEIILFRKNRRIDKHPAAFFIAEHTFCHKSFQHGLDSFGTPVSSPAKYVSYLVGTDGGMFPDDFHYLVFCFRNLGKFHDSLLSGWIEWNLTYVRLL